MKENRITEVEFTKSKIDGLLEMHSSEENFEVCAELRDSIPKFEAFLNGTKTYSEIQEVVEFVNSKISETLPNELKSN